MIILIGSSMSVVSRWKRWQTLLGQLNWNSHDDIWSTRICHICLGGTCMIRTIFSVCLLASQCSVCEILIWSFWWLIMCHLKSKSNLTLQSVYHLVIFIFVEFNFLQYQLQLFWCLMVPNICVFLHINSIYQFHPKHTFFFNQLSHTNFYTIATFHSLPH